MGAGPGHAPRHPPLPPPPPAGGGRSCPREAGECPPGPLPRGCPGSGAMLAARRPGAAGGERVLLPSPVPCPSVGRGGSARGGSRLTASSRRRLWHGPQDNSASPRPRGCAGVGVWAQLGVARWVLGQAERGREGSSSLGHSLRGSG